MVRTRATFDDACEDYLRWPEDVRQRKPSTLRDYRGIRRMHLTPFFAGMALEDIPQADVERWAGQLGRRTADQQPDEGQGRDRPVWVMERARQRHKLPLNPGRDP